MVMVLFTRNFREMVGSIHKTGKLLTIINKISSINNYYCCSNDITKTYSIIILKRYVVVF